MLRDKIQGLHLEQLVDEENENPMEDEKSSVEIAKDVERLIKKPVLDTPEKVEVQKPKYDEKPNIPYP